MKNEKFPPKADPPLAEKINIILLFCMFIICHNLYAEVVWVSDRGAKQLIRVDGQGEKKVIEIKNFANPAIVEVDQRDGSVWVTDVSEVFNNQVVKLNSKGEELFRLGGFVKLNDAGVDAKDGSYFVNDGMLGEIIKISSDGKELFRIKNLMLLSEEERRRLGCFERSKGCHKAYEGTGVNLFSLDDVEICPLDGSIWAADTGLKRLLKFTKEGVKISEKTAIGEPEHLALAPDGACWVNNIEGGRVFKVSSDGREVLGKIEKLDLPFELAVSPLDKTCWVTTRSELIQISPDAKKIIKRLSGFRTLQGLSTINPKNGSFWVADMYGFSREIIKFSQDGKVLKRIGGFSQPRFLEVYWD